MGKINLLNDFFRIIVDDNLFFRRRNILRDSVCNSFSDLKIRFLLSGVLNPQKPEALKLKSF